MKPFIIDNGEYRAEIQENPSGTFGVLYYLDGSPRIFDRSPCNYFNLEEAAGAALAQVLEITTERLREELTEYATDDVGRFEQLIRSICPLGGNPDEYGIRLGNVEFWIDSDGPWANKLSFSIPTSQWDKKRLSADLTAALMATPEERNLRFGGPTSPKPADQP